MWQCVSAARGSKEASAILKATPALKPVFQFVDTSEALKVTALVSTWLQLHYD